jgi:decaprenylphospho-beta-D-ribofuranose 2-oxidase
MSVQPPAIATAWERVCGWGGAGGVTARRLRARSADDVRAALERWRAADRGGQAQQTGVIARGLGRSYGDAAQLGGGFVLDTAQLKGVELDREAGLATAQAGMTIGELLAELVPAGWVVPVVPGTQHVTVAGAIASDIHGKNHGTAGTFGSHVRAIGLLTAAGEVVELQPGDDRGLFDATIGGMGLTGVILWARFALRAVSTALLTVDTDRAATLEDALELLSGPGGPHRVAWLDLLCSKSGRGVVTRAEHLPASAAPPSGSGAATVAARATVPAGWPGGLLRPSSVRAFNELWFRRAPRCRRDEVQGFGAHMFPLDVLDAWPRLYGRAGFLQYQLVVPGGQERVLRAVIDHLRRERIPCFLAVLKDFGPANRAPLSFPIAGWTLALDLPRSAPDLYPALERCDALVAEAGGRVYLTKDSRLRPETVRAMYPRLDEWRAVRDRADPERVWRSDLALRTGLVTL